MKITKKEIEAVTSPLKKIMLADKKEVIYLRMIQYYFSGHRCQFLKAKT